MPEKDEFDVNRFGGWALRDFSTTELENVILDALSAKAIKELEVTIHSIDFEALGKTKISLTVSSKPGSPFGS